MFKRFKIKSSIAQPILTVVLIGLLAVLIIQFANSRNDTDESKQEIYRELNRAVSFESATNAFTNGNFEVYTQGSLYLKEKILPEKQDLSKANSSNNKVVELTENPYTGLFYYVDRGAVKKLTITGFDANQSILYTPGGDLITVSNTARSFSKYPVPADGEKEAKQYFSFIDTLFNTSFPLIPLLNDYKARKFNPTERSTNLYTGMWQHPFFTSGEVMEVIIQTDPVSGLFKSFNLISSGPLSQIYFDFKKIDAADGVYKVPGDYKEVPINLKYKPKS